MISKDINVFLSCSFAEQDAQVNELVRAVCAGVGLTCLNVDAGYPELPPDKAREYIADAAGLIAVATKRDLLANGEFIMPSAVHDEISIAHALKKPILLIGEQGVRFDGFMNNYGTRLPFSRDELSLPPFVRKLVSSIYTFRQGVASTEAALYQYATEYYSEDTRYLVSLEHDGSAYRWTVALTKCLRFEEPLQRDIPTSVWPDVPSAVSPGAPPAEWSVVINSSSRDFKVETFASDVGPDHIDLLLRFHPTPQQGDGIEYTRTFRSRHFNPLYADELPAGVPRHVIINGRSYALHDGVVLVERTKKLHSRYEFPAEYRLSKEDVAVFAASHSYTIDYLAPWELKRVRSEVELFGPKLTVDLHVEEPLPRHMYGLAWTLPDRPAGTNA